MYPLADERVDRRRTSRRYHFALCKLGVIRKSEAPRPVEGYEAALLHARAASVYPTLSVSASPRPRSALSPVCMFQKRASNQVITRRITCPYFIRLLSCRPG